MITAEAERMRVEGPMVMATAGEVRAAGDVALAGGAVEVDLSAVTDVDSSAVAVLLAWTRLARERQQALAITGAPASIRSLATLYGVADMLPLG